MTPLVAADRSVVALGGGHGLFASLSALRRVVERVTAVVTVADDGGSSGRLRESFGIALVVLYLFVLPVALVKLKWTRRRFGRFYEKMGPARYYTGITLFLIMLALPIKMFCRWVFNLKYFVHIQEYFFNI